MVQYAQKECYDCHGVFPGNQMIRISEEQRSKSTRKGREERTQYGNNVSVGVGPAEVTTHISTLEFLICKRCRSRRARNAFLQFLLLMAAIGAVIAYALNAPKQEDETEVATAIAPATNPEENPQIYADEELTQPVAPSENGFTSDSQMLKGDAIGLAAPVDAEPDIGPSNVTASSGPSLARAATVQGSPADWVTLDDYPKAARRERREGITSLALTISPIGRVTDCEVSASSGSADLDAVACQKVIQRGEFSPALDAAGEATESVYNSRIKWRLPLASKNDGQTERVLDRILNGLLSQ